MSTDTSTPPGAPASTWRRVLIAVAALVAIAITLSLGRWPLSRAAQKEALQAAISEQKTLPALGGPALAATKDIANVLHRRVVLRGTWLPRNFLDRTQLPPLDTPTGVVALEGRVARPPSKLFEFAAVQSPTGAGKPAQRSSHIRQNLDLADFRAETQLPLRDVSVLQTGDASEGLLRDWPEVASGVEKHYGYAFQWFGLAGLITLLYVWFQIVRRFHPARRSPASAPE